MLHVFLELDGVALAELLQCGLELLLLDIFIFFILVLAWKILPWQRTPEEVNDNMADGLEVISPGLLLT
jgi:hypothetical protein